MESSGKLVAKSCTSNTNVLLIVAPPEFGHAVIVIPACGCVVAIGVSTMERSCWMRSRRGLSHLYCQGENFLLCLLILLVVLLNNYLGIITQALQH